MSDAFSIRQSLQGALQDFVRQSAFKCVRTEEMVRELVCLLAAYREEDVPLYPEVFVVATPNTLNTIAPAADRRMIGRSNLGGPIAAELLKNCASLAVDGWAIYVAGTADELAEYGLIRAQRHSFATSADESIRDLGEKTPIVLIRNRGHFVVELQNSQGRVYTVDLTSRPPAPAPLRENVAAFVQSATAITPPTHVKQFQPYLTRLLMRILLRCHGTLLAVIDVPNTDNLPAQLRDGVWLNLPVDLCSRHQAAIEHDDANTLADLQSVESLVSGMLNSDGLVVFGSDGAVLAYRVFLKPEEAEFGALPERGGGRRRTYELMKLRLGTIFRAALFRSQDGETECQCERPNT